MHLIYSLLFIAQFCLIHGFCIYNKSDKFSFFIHQEPMNAGANWLSRFKRDELVNGDKACCPWTDWDCNSAGKKEAILLFTFRAIYLGENNQSFTLNVPAGGWIDFLPDEDGNGIPTINVYEADGTRFNAQYQTGVRKMMLY